MSSRSISHINETKPTSFAAERSEEEKSYRIMQLLKNCLVETASVTFLTKVTCIYAVSSKAIKSLTMVGVSILSANILLKSGITYLQYQRLKYSLQQDISPQNCAQTKSALGEVCQWVAPLNFALFFSTTGNLLIHEAGHVAIASLVYKNLQAQITIPGLFRAAVSWTKTGFTPFGSLLGGLNSRLLVCIAGPLTAVLAGTIAIVAGKHFKDRFPELSKYLISSAVCTIAYQALYALSALRASQSDLSQDFVMLWHVGIHPAFASILLVSIPMVALAAYQRLRARDRNDI